MATRRKYRLKKRVKNFLIFYIVVCTFFVASYTLSRYVKTTSGTSGIDIAKFKVSVNDINVSDGTPIEFGISKSTKFTSNKIAPNSKGYFEFILNPDGTEVSLEYELKFLLDDIDKDFKLEYFTVNDSEEHYDITDGNTAKNDLLISSNEVGFTSADKINIKVYWNWDDKEDITNPNMEDYDNKNINVIAIVKQKIN